LDLQHFDLATMSCCGNDVLNVVISSIDILNTLRRQSLRGPLNTSRVELVLEDSCRNSCYVVWQKKLYFAQYFRRVSF